MAKPLTSQRPKALLAVASIAIALSAADTYVVVLALEDMMRGVGIGVDALQKAAPIISGFLLGYVTVLPLIGRLADVASRSRILMWCLFIFVIGSAVTALATDLSVMVTGRVIQGVGGGGLVPATLALVADLWPRGRRGTALGVVGAVQELGSVLGPLLGALILAVSDWRMIFWLNAIAGIVLALAIRWIGGASAATGPRLPRWYAVLTTAVGVLTAAVLALALAAPDALTTSIRWGGPFVPYGNFTARLATPIGVTGLVLLAVALLVSARYWWPILRSVDLLGAALIGAALGALVLTFATANPEKQVVGPVGFWLLPIGALALVLYAVRHRVAASPLLARGIFNGRVRPAAIVSVLVGTALVAIVVDIPLLARLTETDSQTTAALVLVRFLLAVPIGALLGGWLLRRIGPGFVAAPGLLATAVGLLAMSRWGEGSLHGLLPTVVLVIVGLGVGLAIAPVNDAALHDAPHDAHGVASAIIVVARMIGMVVGLALLTAIGLHRFYVHIQAIANPSADQIVAAGVVQVQTVFLGAAVAAFVAALVALTLGRRAQPPVEI